ncbi:MAG TPA: fibronectin type III domain-containing protein, partial [Thermoanaerobaculia bacterium]|nr:fibronectin type III domain-containing protein [Thermoanaerobaculia bacterium]
VSPGRFRLSWNDRSGREEGFLLEFLGATGWRPFVSLPAGTTSFDLPSGGLVPKFFRVSAFNARGKSAPSEIASAGGAPPTADVSLRAEKGDGLAARLSLRTIGFEEILLERSVDDAPFVEIARPRTLDGASCCQTIFVDTARTPDHDVVYRARVVNPAGFGPESLASLGTWTSPPEAPDGLAASTVDNRITASWNDRSRSEDGFRLFSRRPFAPGEVRLGDTTRGRTRFEGYNLGYFGDVELTVRAFNSAGLSAPSPPFRLRIWPYVERLDEESTGLTPELVPFVVEKTGGDGPEEHTEIERFARSLYDGPTFYGRFLDSVSDTLLQLEVPLPRIELGQNPFIVTSRAFVDSVMRPQHPGLPRGDVAGALLMYAQRALGARTHVRVKANLPGGDADGRPGFGFSGRQVKELTAGPLAFGGLRREGPLTSSLTLVHPGVDPSPLVFGVTLFDGESGASTDLPDVTVARGAVVTLDDVLSRATPPARQGWAIVRRVEGDSPIDAFAVAHDRLSFDGAYIGAAKTETSRALWLPAVVESASYETEAVFTNGLDREIEILVTYVESLPGYRADLVPVSFTVGARRQLIVPSFVDALRRRGLPLGTRGETRVGTIRVTRADGGALGAVFVGERVVSSDGRYSLHVGGVAEGRGTEGRTRDASDALDGVTHVYGLPENPRERSNAVVANLSLEPVTVRADVVSCPALVYDIACGALPRVEGSTAFTLRPGEWFQMHRPFRPYGRERGLVDFTRLSGPGPLYAYSVVVDAVTGDGTFFEASGSEP